MLTKLDDDLPEVVGMPAPAPEALVADGALVLAAAEDVLLHVAHALHHQAYRKENDTGNVAPRPEAVLRVGLHGGRVEHGDGQADGPHPDHLEDPEAEEGEELVALVVEAVVLARLQDPEEQEAREPQRPGHDEERGDDLPGAIVPAEGQGDDGEEGEVGPTREVWEL